MPCRNPVQRFGDIVAGIDSIQNFTAGMDLAAFESNEQTVRALKYSLLIISEAATKLGGLAPELCPELPWRAIRGLGNRLRHDYADVDVRRIWLLIERDLPALTTASLDAMRNLAG